MRIQLLPIATALLLCGCSAQMIRDSAQTEMRAGHVEAAIKQLEEGVQRHPDSPLLRSSLLATREEAVARWAAQAVQLSSAGRFEEAEALLRRALALEPKNDRLQSLVHEIRAESRVRTLIATAEKHVAAGRKDAAIQALDAALREVPRHAAASAMRRQLEADLRMESGGSGRVRLAETRPVSLDFRGAPLTVVLEALTRGSGINFILDRDVRQDNRVTVFLRSASVEDALDLITGAHQLSRRIVDAQTVLIYPNTAEKQREHQEQVVRVFHLANADAKSAAQLLRSMLRVRDPFVDERANMVAIRESPDVVAMAERLIALHDSGDAEVMLDVEILEVKTNRLTELGINVPNSLTLTPLGIAGTTSDGSGLTVRNLRDINSSRIGVSVGNVVLNLRREVGDFNILANPRIRAKNREKARVVIGDRFPVVTSTANATGFVSESISYLEVGLKLDVEPVVSLDDDVTIKLGLEVSAISGSVRTAGGSLAYQVGTRNANTTLRLRDGETQILAGLISNDDRSSASRIPGLGDLPVAGRLFSSQKDEFQRTELMLAITPRVIRSAFRPDATQAEMWIGTESSPRLKGAPRTNTATAAVSPVGTASPAGAALRPAPQNTPAPPGPVALSVQGTPSLKVGEVRSVPIQISSATPIRGAMVELGFDPAKVEVIEVVEGTFFKDPGGTTSFTQSVNVGTGKVAIGVLRGDTVGASGVGQAFELRVRAKTPGTTEMTVTSLRPVGTGVPVEADASSKFSLTAQ